MGFYNFFRYVFFVRMLQVGTRKKQLILNPRGFVINDISEIMYFFSGKYLFY